MTPAVHCFLLTNKIQFMVGALVEHSMAAFAATFGSTIAGRRRSRLSGLA